MLFEPRQRPSHFSALEHYAELAASDSLGFMQQYHKLQTKLTTTEELKAAVQTTWDELPQEHINAGERH